MGAKHGRGAKRKQPVTRLTRPIAWIAAAMAMTTTAGPAFAKNDIRFISIGGLDWVSHNIDAATFRNGEPIPIIDDAVAWEKAGKAGLPAMTIYQGPGDRPGKWGRLYNYAAVIDARGLCPDGWRVPDDGDWAHLERELGSSSAALRLRARSGWLRGTGLDDVGFAALPAGFRTQRGDYFLGGRVAYFWSASEVSPQETTAQMLFDYDNKIFRIVYDKSMGMSLRCVRQRTP